MQSEERKKHPVAAEINYFSDSLDSLGLLSLPLLNAHFQ